MKLLQKFKYQPGFSLVETLITLIVVCIIIIMLTNVLAITLKVSVLASERSHIKNELSNLFQKLDRDVANAEYVHIASPDTLIVETTDHRVRWQTCESDNTLLTAGNAFSLCQYYCQLDATDISISTCDPSAGTTRLQTKSSPKLVIESFMVDEIESASQFKNERIKSAVVTIKAEHYTDTVNGDKGLGIKNLFKQITISSNNFII